MESLRRHGADAVSYKGVSVNVPHQTSKITDRDGSALIIRNGYGRMGKENDQNLRRLYRETSRKIQKSQSMNFTPGQKHATAPGAR